MTSGKPDKRRRSSSWTGPSRTRSGSAYDDLAALPAEDQIPDVSAASSRTEGHRRRPPCPAPPRRARGPRRGSSRSTPTATTSTSRSRSTRSATGAWSSTGWATARSNPAQGGPIRFLIRDPAVVPHGRARRLREREVPQPDRADRPAEAATPVPRTSGRTPRCTSGRARRADRGVTSRRAPTTRVLAELEGEHGDRDRRPR